MKWIARAALGLGIVALVAILVVRQVIVPRIDAAQNGVVAHAPYEISPEAQVLHDQLMVADLHGDLLLWSREPRKRHSRGHKDFPRLREGRMFLQVFSVVTKSPSGQNYEKNTADTDRITSLAMAQGWPMATWGSLEARANFQAEKLRRAAFRDGRFYLIETRDDLDRALAARAEDLGVLAGVLGTEGSHALEGDLSAIDRLYDRGYRIMGLHHFFDNELGGSLHGTSGAGLSAFGEAAVSKMVDKQIIIDVAHSSEAVVRDVMALTDRPLIVSHTGIKSLCDTSRNISDELVREITERGGLIGIGFWDDAVCDASPQGLARTIRAAIDLFGEEAIALGSDFDGAVTTYLDASELAALTQALINVGLSSQQIENVMGGNQIRFFRQWLPEEGDT